MARQFSPRRCFSPLRQKQGATSKTSALAGVAIQGSDTGKGQDLVNQFCAQATGSGDVIADKLEAMFGSAIASDVYKKLKSNSSAQKIAKCSCETEQSTNSIGFDIGECVQDVLCGGLGIGCNCTRRLIPVNANPAQLV